jgi:hypothetical protein|eukprot:COSAG01_NODE_2962_length_6786_cov_21.580544_9_plen_172_part_00
MLSSSSLLPPPRLLLAVVCAGVALTPRACRAAIAADLVSALPGWGPQPLASRIYSGYFVVPAPQGHSLPRHLHYVFIESEASPATDPVMLWVNGGPGSSSLKGVFSQLGPYSLNDASYPGGDPNASAANLRLARNNFTWNAFASILYLEQPAGVHVCILCGVSCRHWSGLP